MHRAPSPSTLPWIARPGVRAWRTEPFPDGVLAFHAGLPGYRPTPLVDLPDLAAELGVGRVLAKDESARLGLPAFKALGASWAVRRALDAHVAGGGALPVTFTCATDGNHGRAVARFAAALGQASVVHIAPGVHPDAVAAIAAEGARVVLGASSYDHAVANAAASAAEPGTILVQDMGWPGYEAIPGWIVEGYATLCAEIDGQLASAGHGGPDLVVIPVGVGSLAHAVTVHYRSRPAGVPPALLAVEPMAAACLLESLRAGAPVTLDTGSTIMAGLNCGTPSGLGWPVLEAGLDAAVAIADAPVVRAAGDLARLGVPAGPCGAATLAGLRAALHDDPGGARRTALGLTSASVVVLLVTEGVDANPLPSMPEIPEPARTPAGGRARPDDEGARP